MTNRTAERLLEAVRLAAPGVTDVRIGQAGVPASVTVFPVTEQAAAQATIDAFDWSAAAQNQWLADRRAAEVGRVTMVRLAFNRTNDTVALADATGLSFRLLPNRHYVFSFVGAYTAAAGTTGARVAVNGPASPNLLRAIQQVWESASGQRVSAVGAYDTPVLGVNSGGATPLPFEIKGNISTGAAGGVLVLRFASEVAGSTVTILAGSWGELKAVG